MIIWNSPNLAMMKKEKKQLVGEDSRPALSFSSLKTIQIALSGSALLAHGSSGIEFKQLFEASSSHWKGVKI